jgi:hypothetical protein
MHVRLLMLRRINYENQLPVFLTLAVSLIINLLKRSKSRAGFYFCDLTYLHSQPELSLSVFFLYSLFSVILSRGEGRFLFRVYCALTCKFRSLGAVLVQSASLDIHCDCGKLCGEQSACYSAGIGIEARGEQKVVASLLCNLEF